jgi:hypothetical protein
MAMKRLLRALSIAIVVSLLCLVGVIAALYGNHRALRSASTTQPTQRNTAKFTMDDRQYYAPANLVHRRLILGLLFVLLLLILVLLGFTRNVVRIWDARQRRLQFLQTLQIEAPQPDFSIEDGSISWVIPRSVKWSVIRSPRGWLPFLVMLVFGWLVLDIFFRWHPQPNTPADLLAFECMAATSLSYPLIAFILLRWTSIVTLDDAGITFQVAGKTGRRSTCPYRSVAGCWIEPSRWVPSLPCVTFKAPGRLRAEKTNRLDMPPEADVRAVIQFLATKGVTCADRR